MCSYFFIWILDVAELTLKLEKSFLDSPMQKFNNVISPASPEIKLTYTDEEDMLQISDKVGLV